MAIDPFSLVVVSGLGIASFFTGKSLLFHVGHLCFTPKLYEEQPGAPPSGMGTLAWVHYLRGYFFHERGFFELAKADYEKALVLSPQSSVINILREKANGRELPPDSIPELVTSTVLPPSSWQPKALERSEEEHPADGQGRPGVGRARDGESPTGRSRAIPGARDTSSVQSVGRSRAIPGAHDTSSVQSVVLEASRTPDVVDVSRKPAATSVDAIMSVVAGISDYNDTMEAIPIQLILKDEADSGKIPNATRQGLAISDLKALPLFNQGRDYHEKGEFAQAVMLYSQAIANDPQCAEVYMHRGIVFCQMCNYKEAQTDFTKSIAVRSDNAVSYYLRGKLQLLVRQFELAIADFSQAIQIRPNYVEALDQRGVGYLFKKYLASAIADFTRAIELKENFAQAYNHRGIALFMQGKKSEAQKDFLRAGELNPKLLGSYPGHAEILMKLGVDSFAKGLTAQAIKAFSSVIAIAPRQIMAFINRGTCYQHLLEFDKAIDDLTHVLALNPRHIVTYNKRGETFLKKNRYREAIADFEKAIALNPRFVPPHLNKGRANIQRGRHEQALADFNSAIDHGARNPEIYYERGMQRLNLGDMPGALADFKSGCDLGQRAFDKLQKLLTGKRSSSTL